MRIAPSPTPRNCGCFFLFFFLDVDLILIQSPICWPIFCSEIELCIFVEGERFDASVSMLAMAYILYFRFWLHAILCVCSSRSADLDEDLTAGLVFAFEIDASDASIQVCALYVKLGSRLEFKCR